MKQIIFLFIIISFFSCKIISKKGKDYKNRIEISNKIYRNYGFYTSPFIDYFAENCILPSVNNAFDYYKSFNPNEKKSIKRIFFHDFWSSNADSLLKYIPLYDSKTNQKRYLLVLSRGPDGKFNFHYNNKDSIYLYDVKKKISLYNSKHLERGSYLKAKRRYLGGKKDLCIGIYDSYSFFIGNNFNIRIQNDSFLLYPNNFSYKVKVKSKQKLIFQKDSMIFQSPKVINLQLLKYIHNDDSVIISGYLRKTKYSKIDTIFLTCVVLDTGNYMMKNYMRIKIRELDSLKNAIIE